MWIYSLENLCGYYHFQAPPKLAKKVDDMENDLSFDTADLRSSKNIFIAGLLSSLAYQPEHTIRQSIITFGGNPDEVYFLYGENLFGYVANITDVTFIIFRGTKTLGDWINNIDIRKVQTRFGDIHKGFARSLNSISIHVIQEIESTFDKPPKLCLCGHSRGGAFAMIATAVLTELGYDPISVYTFGQPKVGGHYFCEWWEHNVTAEYVRVINKKDIVPHLPPGIEDLPYFILLFAKLPLLLLTLPIRAAQSFLRRSMAQKRSENVGI